MVDLDLVHVLTDHDRYMDKSGIVEAGTHEELLSGEGEYARIWKLQAQAFV